MNIRSIEVRRLTWWYHNRERAALRDVSFSIDQGERVLVTGASGSAKSTLLQLLVGALTAGDDGELRGECTVTAHPVALLSQEPHTQVTARTVGDEVAFGLQNLSVPRAEILERVPAALADVGILDLTDLPPEELSAGQQQRMLTAAVLAMRAKLLLLDEPTSLLDAASAEVVRRALVTHMSDPRRTTLIVDHDEATWRGAVTRVLELREGELVRDERIDTHFQWPTGAPGSARSPKRESAGEPGTRHSQTALNVGKIAEPNHDRAVVLTARDLEVGYDDAAVARLENFELRQGDIVAFTQESGAGKTAAALTLSGLNRPVSGHLTPPVHELDAASLTTVVALSFQHPELQFVHATVDAELDHRRDLALALGLESVRSAHPLTLSGGQKRRLSIAAALAQEPSVLVLDEPTFGQDDESAEAIRVLLAQSAARGTAVVVFSHDLTWCDRLGATRLNLQPVARTRHAKAAARRWFHPFAKLFSITAVTLSLVLTSSLLSVGVAAVGVVVLVLLSPTLRRGLGRYLGPLAALATLTGFTVALYSSATDEPFFQLLWAQLSADSLALGATAALRVFSIALLSIAVFRSLSLAEVGVALEQQARLPARATVSTMATLSSVTALQRLYRQRQNTLRARGISPQRGLRHLSASFIAVALLALRRAELLALALHARALDGAARRTQLFTVRWTWRDRALCGVAVAAAFSIVALHGVAR